MDLFAALDQYDTPREAFSPEFICTIKTSRSGRQIMLCSVDPAPKAAVDQAVKAGFPLFVASEIAQMADIDAATLDTIVLVKTEFPGCRVEQVLRDKDLT